MNEVWLNVFLFVMFFVSFRLYCVTYLNKPHRHPPSTTVTTVTNINHYSVHIRPFFLMSPVLLCSTSLSGSSRRPWSLCSVCLHFVRFSFEFLFLHALYICLIEFRTHFCVCRFVCCVSTNGTYRIHVYTLPFTITIFLPCIRANYKLQCAREEKNSLSMYDTLSAWMKVSGTSKTR